MQYPDIESLAVELRAEVGKVFTVSDVTWSGRIVRFSGRLLADPERAFSLLEERFARYGYLPSLQRRAGEVVVFAIPAPKEMGPQRAWVNLVLFLATVLTTMYAGAAEQGQDPLRNWRSLAAGVPFAFALLSTLGAHELAHYFMSRRYGLRASLPYFIPSPFWGTFGAIIRMTSPTKNRKVLFDVGLAGPLASLAMSIPFLIIGLSHSQVLPQPTRPMLGLGSPLLIDWIARLVVGPLPKDIIIRLHPLGLAGWLGLFVTGMNLLPVGQSDGGHVAYALLGRFYRLATTITLLAMATMGLLFWQGWLIWTMVLFALGAQHPAPLDGLTELDGKRKLLGALALSLLAIILTPAPFAIVR